MKIGAHGAILGMTESGKTFLARQMARDFRKSDIRTIVLRKELEPWSTKEAWFQTDNPEEFLSQYERIGRDNQRTGNSAVCFMELADADVDKYDIRFHRCFTRGRHMGFRCYYMTQRAASVHPAIRENCSQLYIFTVARKGAQLWADEFCDEEILKAATLPSHRFIHKETRYAPARFRVLEL